MARTLLPAILATALSLPLAACGGDTGPSTPVFPPLTDPGGGGGGGKDTAGGQDPGGASDAAGGEGDLGPTTEPSVVLLGIDGMPPGADIACGASQVVLARAHHVSDKVVRAFAKVGADTFPFAVAGVPDPDDPTLLSFTIDLSCFAEGADPCDPDNPDAGPAVKDGQPVTLGVAAFDDDSLGSVPAPPLSDSRPMIFDNADPTLEMAVPDPEFLPITVAGRSQFAGKARDGRGVASLDVYFAGVLVDSFVPPEGEEANWDFDVEADFGDTQTGYDTLTVVVRDTCGNETTFETEASVVKWPRLRSYERYTLPGSNVIIEDSVLTDWDEDGYPDIIYATNKGLIVALNDGEDADVGGPGAKGRFPEMMKISSNWAITVSPIDVDVDGRMDLASVERRAGGEWLVIYRNLGDGVLISDELHELELNSSTKIVDMVVADFSENSAVAPDGMPRDDIVIATDAESEAILLFKRQIPEDAPSDFDQCKEVAQQVEGGADGQTETVMQCPTLFADAVKAGGISNITQIVAWDVTGVQDTTPDGLPDLVVGADDLNQIVVYGNRFSLTNKLDTAFSASTVSFVWPEPQDAQQRAQFFCLGQFIKTGEAAEDDPIDIVVGTEKSGTWRVLRGVGGGKFLNGKQASDDPWDPWNYAGTSGTEVRGLACGDFNGDGNDDFAIMSNQSLLMQVHLGNGKGRFNQIGPDRCDPNNSGCQAVSLLNPVNEGIGFVIERESQNPHVGDFDQDGKLDILMDFRLGGFGLFMNDTDCEAGQCGAGDRGFDLVGTRALRTPLGITTSSSGGQLAGMAIGDVTGDGKDDIVGLRPAYGLPNLPWIKTYHSNAQAYRSFYSTGGKTFPGYLVYVWSPGTHGPDLPSYPAAYDHIAPESYGESEHGVVDVEVLKLYDVVGADGSVGPDGNLDLLVGGQKGGVVDSGLGLVRNLGGDFWDPTKVTAGTHSMFYPQGGSMAVPSKISGFGLLNPAGTAVPSVVVGIQKYSGEPAALPWTARVCNWGQMPEPFTSSYWVCPKFGLIEDAYGKEIGGVVNDIKRIAVEGPDAGKATEDPNVAADLIVLNSITRSITYFPWDGTSPAFPWGAPVEKAIGKAPENIDFNDLDNDGNLDFAAAVFRNVFVAFGQDALDPFEAPLPVDKDPSVEQTGPDSVVTTDINFDGLADIVFTERTLNALKIYLNIGASDDPQKGIRKFHGPITVPLCKLPSQIVAHNFSPATSDCEDLVVLCDDAGGIAILRNESADCEK